MQHPNMQVKYFPYIVPQIANNPKPNSMITRKMIRCQLKKDLIGKDVYRGTTQTYTLLANQFGHFALGFITATIFWAIIHCFTHNKHLLHLSWILSAFIWTVFEIVHFQHSVVAHRKKEKEKQEKGLQQFPFKPAWGNIRNDTLTDITFFCAGAFAAGCLLIFTIWLLPLFLLSFTIAVYLFRRWYIKKMYLQEAIFPFHYRLSQWVISISEENAAIANQFLKTEKKGQHLLIFGESIPEKTSLSIGIATELAFTKQKSCLYLTATKLFTMFTLEDMDSNPSLELESLWSWRKTALLLIDDINPSHTNGNKLLSAKEFCDNINHAVHGKLNKETLSNNNVIWVLGNDTTSCEKQKEWEDMLIEIGIEKTNISTIHL
jgi:multisubunit Na+/H+ antiporter MnhE subunit